jgi:septal ring factor EnvC (AmiA/AmiB activator)
MKNNDSGLITLNVNIPEDIYRKVLHVIKTSGQEASTIKMITAGLFRLTLDTIKYENTSLSSRIDNLQNEINRLIEENNQFEKLCSESRKDNDYVYKRLEKLNAENEELELSVKQQSSTLQRGI